MTLSAMRSDARSCASTRRATDDEGARITAPLIATEPGGGCESVDRTQSANCELERWKRRSSEHTHTHTHTCSTSVGLPGC